MQTSMSMEEALMNRLCTQAEQCRLCPNMSFGRTFLNEHNGNWSADVMFIGEATNVGTDDQLPKPMWDSPSGTNLNKLLNSIGLQREEVFVTNTVLHTPITPEGHMRYVTDEEQQNCSGFLIEQIEVVDPKIICTLGNRALSGLAKALPHELILKRDVGRIISSGKRFIIPLYHPSPNVISTWRTFDQQVIDYDSILIALDHVKIWEQNR
jgi:uracil-DNA glycosylase family 4